MLEVFFPLNSWPTSSFVYTKSGCRPDRKGTSIEMKTWKSCSLSEILRMTMKTMIYGHPCWGNHAKHATA